MNMNTEVVRLHLSKTRMPLYFSLPSVFDLGAPPHLVTVALAHAAIAATHCALDLAHPVLALTARPGGTPPELTDAEHFAAMILVVSDELAELLDDYAATYDLEPHDDAPTDAPALR